MPCSAIEALCKSFQFCGSCKAGTIFDCSKKEQKVICISSGNNNPELISAILSEGSSFKAASEEYQKRQPTRDPSNTGLTEGHEEDLTDDLKRLVVLHAHHQLQTILESGEEGLSGKALQATIERTQNLANVNLQTLFDRKESLRPADLVRLKSSAPIVSKYSESAIYLYELLKKNKIDSKQGLRQLEKLSLISFKQYERLKKLLQEHLIDEVLESLDFWKLSSKAQEILFDAAKLFDSTQLRQLKRSSSEQDKASDEDVTTDSILLKPPLKTLSLKDEHLLEEILGTYTLPQFSQKEKQKFLFLRCQLLYLMETLPLNEEATSSKTEAQAPSIQIFRDLSPEKKRKFLQKNNELKKIEGAILHIFFCLRRFLDISQLDKYLTSSALKELKIINGKYPDWFNRLQNNRASCLLDLSANDLYLLCQLASKCSDASCLFWAGHYPVTSWKEKDHSIAEPIEVKKGDSFHFLSARSSTEGGGGRRQSLISLKKQRPAIERHHSHDIGQTTAHQRRSDPKKIGELPE